MRALWLTLGAFGIGLLVTACDHGEATFPTETNTTEATAAQPTQGLFGNEASATITNGQDATFQLTAAYEGTVVPGGNTFGYPATILLDGAVLNSTSVLFTIDSAPEITTAVDGTVGAGATAGGTTGGTGIGGGWTSGNTIVRPHPSAAHVHAIQTSTSGVFDAELALTLVAVPVGTHTLTVHWDPLPAGFSGTPLTDMTVTLTIAASSNG